MSVTKKPIHWRLILGLLGAATCGLALLVPPELVEANVDLLYFRAVGGTDAITLEWETASELDNLGFNLYRSTTGNWADATRLNNNLIPSQVGGQPTGAFYQFPDGNVVPDIVYTYWLEDIDFNGGSQRHDPVEATLVTGNTIPTQPPPPAASTATATSTRTPTATATATTSTDSNATATPTRTPLPVATAINTPSPTATIAAASQNQTLPSATQPPATPSTAGSTAAPGSNGYPVATELDQSQPAALEGETREPAVDPEMAAAGEVEPASNSPEDGRQALADALSAAPIGSGSQPQNAQVQEGSNDDMAGPGMPLWLIFVLVAGLLLALAAGATTLFVLNQRSTK